MSFLFHDYELDEDRFTLERRGEILTLQRKPLLLLIYLLRNAGRAVPNAELTRVLWPDVTVTDASLRRAVKVLRQALGDDGQRLIESIRGYGYRFGGEVSTRARARSGLPNAAPGRFDLFVGRDEELAVLDRELEAAMSGAGRSVLVVGAPGMGKTRLVREFTERVEARGLLALQGQCWGGDDSPPFWPWGPLLQELAAGDSQTPLQEWLKPDAAPTRFRLFADAATALRASAEREPLVLIIEDIQWAAEPALLLLRFVLEQTQKSKLLVVCTCRDSAPQASDPRVALIAGLGARSRSVEVGPLQHGDVGTVLRNESSLSVDDKLVSDVLHWTGGCPLFVRGLVPVLEAARAVGASDRPPFDFANVPQSIRETIRAQVQPLGAQAVSALQAAAVLGEEFSLPPLRELLGLGVDELVDIVERAAARRILSSSGPGTYRFSHALVRETLYGELGGADRLRLHREAALAYERLGFADSDDHAATLAQHHTRALPLSGSLERAIDCTLRAGRWSLQNFAYEQARDHFRQAIELIDQAPPSIDSRAAALLGLGDALALCGATADAKRTLVDLAELTRGACRPDLLAEAALGYGRVHFETHFMEHRLVALLEEALAALPNQDSPQRVALLSRLSFANHFDRDFREQLASTDGAVAMAERLGDGRALAEAMVARAYALWSGSDPQDRSRLLEAAEQALAAALRYDNHERVAFARMFRVIALLERGFGTEMRAELARYMEVCDRMLHPTLDWFGRLTQAALATLEGRFEESRALSDAAFSTGQKIGVGTAPIFYAAQNFARQRERGELRTWLERFGDATKQRDVANQGLAWASCALAKLSCGEMDRARQDLRELAAAGLRTQATKHNWPATLTIAGEAAAGLAELGAAEELYDLLLPHESLIAGVGSVAGVFGIAAHTLGQIALALGHRERSLDHLEVALQLTTRLGAPPWQARVLLSLGQAWLALGKSDDAARALREARQIAEPLGMKHVLAQLAGLGGT